MDPIHPIIPITPAIPTVTPAPLVGRIDRDNAQHDAGEGQRRRRRPQPQDAPDGSDYGPDGDDETGLHINVTA
jgi:hypothetical protein